MLNDPNGYDWPMPKPPPYKADDEDKVEPVDVMIDRLWIEIDSRLNMEDDNE